MGNDTAGDLKDEYRVAFACYDVDEAVRLLDEFFRNEYLDDEDEYPNYIYSLALFMYNNGFLTEDVRKRAIDCINQNKGLDIYAESGEKVLKGRIKILSDFKTRITSQMPQKKKIKLNVNNVPIFTVGDMIALKLNTDRQLVNNFARVDVETFHSMNGKYFVIQKIADNISWTSRINTSVHDIWPRFMLYDYLGDTIPLTDGVKNLGPVYNTKKIFNFLFTDPYIFYCESKMYHFKKRDYCVIGNYEIQGRKQSSSREDVCIFNSEFDAKIISLLLKNS